MIATVTNLSATDPVVVGHPFNVTIAASGNVALGVSMDDLLKGEDQGDAAYKRLNRQINIGEITVAFAADAESNDTLDAANAI
jgi:hypothetical protein